MLVEHQIVLGGLSGFCDRAKHMKRYGNIVAMLGQGMAKARNCVMLPNIREGPADVLSGISFVSLGSPLLDPQVALAESEHAGS
jgi:hypothetical protein